MNVAGGDVALNRMTYIKALLVPCWYSSLPERRDSTMPHVWDRLISSGGERMKEAGAAEPVRILGMKGKSQSSSVLFLPWSLFQPSMSLRRYRVHRVDGSVLPTVVP